MNQPNKTTTSGSPKQGRAHKPQDSSPVGSVIALRSDSKMRKLGSFAFSSSIWKSPSNNLPQNHKTSPTTIKPLQNQTDQYTSSPNPTKHRKQAVSPLLALTSEFLRTCQKCNSNFRYSPAFAPKRVLTKPSESNPQNNYDNIHGNYILYVHDVLGNKLNQYTIIELLGEGTFGQVAKCQNLQTKEFFAIKIIKNKPAYFKQGLVEISILELLNQKGEHNIVKMKEYFVFREHLCIVFEQLNINLYELIKQNKFKGLSLSLIRCFLVQIITALKLLSRLCVIHCDLKPENILLESGTSPAIKVIDFGSACLENQTVYSYIQSRFYRSPEVLLGDKYGSAIDIWSLGCIGAELFLGLPLFPGNSEYNQLFKIIDMLGTPPEHLIQSGSRSRKFLTQDSSGWVLKSELQFQQETNQKLVPDKRYFRYKTLDEIILNNYFKEGLSSQEIAKEKEARVNFVHFLKGCLEQDPHKRWTAEQAALHPFVTGEAFSPQWTPPEVSKPKQTIPKLIPWGISHANSQNFGRISNSGPANNLFVNFQEKKNNSFVTLGANFGAGAATALPGNFPSSASSEFGIGTPHFPHGSYYSSHGYVPSSPMHQFNLYHKSQFSVQQQQQQHQYTHNPPTHQFGPATHFVTKSASNPMHRRHSFTQGSPPPTGKHPPNPAAPASQTEDEDDLLFQFDIDNPNAQMATQPPLAHKPQGASGNAFNNNSLNNNNNFNHNSGKHKSPQSGPNTPHSQHANPKKSWRQNTTRHRSESDPPQGERRTRTESDPNRRRGFNNQEKPEKAQDRGSERHQDRGSYERNQDRGSYEKVDRCTNERNQDRGSYERNQDRGSYERNQDRGSYERNQDRGSYERNQDRGSYERNQDRGSYERNQDRGSYEKVDRGTNERNQDRGSYEKLRDRGSYEKVDRGTNERNQDRGSYEKIQGHDRYQPNFKSPPSKLHNRNNSHKKNQKSK